MGRDAHHPQPLRRVCCDLVATQGEKGAPHPLPRLQRRHRPALRVPAAARPELLPHQGGAHGVRPRRRPHGVVDHCRLRHAGIPHPADAPQRDSCSPEGVVRQARPPLPERHRRTNGGCRGLGQRLDDTRRERRADFPADAFRRRSLHQHPRGGLHQLRHDASGADRPDEIPKPPHP